MSRELKELASNIKSKSKGDGSNITVAMKTYLDAEDYFVYKTVVVVDFAFTEETELTRDKDLAEAEFKELQIKYKI